MGIMGKLFGSEAVLKKATDGVYKAVDKSIFTDEEKKDWFARIITLYEPFKLAQRYLALILSIPFAFFHVVCGLMLVVSACFPYCVEEAMCKSMQIKSISAQLFVQNNETLGLLVTVILGFYFTGGVLEGGLRTFYDRWSGNRKQ